jgi:hypothetical protein
MRALWCSVLGLAACSQVTPVGSFRLPVPTSSTSVVLMTVLAKTTDTTLVLYDTEHQQVFGEGRGNLSGWDATIPYQFTVPAGNPLQLTLAEGVLQDIGSRPYKTVAIQALDVGVTSLNRVTLTAGTDQRTFVSTGGNIFTETAEPQPMPSETPGPLFALSSVAGVGLTIPDGFDTPTNWTDAISAYIPPDPMEPIACAAPLVSAIRSLGPVSVTVPAGTFQAMHVTEVIDACNQPSMAQVLVFQIDRWYAAGVGPVQMSYIDSLSNTHVYKLQSSVLTTHDSSWWPLDQGNSWTYQVLDPTGMPAMAPDTVTVTNVNVVTQP